MDHGSEQKNQSKIIKILNGNEIIIQGALEAGFSLYTGYPGSPLADYFNILYARKKEFEDKGIKVVIANSEANAAAMASGAKQANRDVLVAMKSMGLHVASDALSVGNFANPGDIQKNPETGEDEYAGVVIAVGDDPWSISTSTAADSRYLFKHLHIPFLEPSSPQELKDWMQVALKISKKTSVYQGVLLTTYMAEGGGRIELGEEKTVDANLTELNTSQFDLSRNVMVPPNSLKADTTMIKERFPRVISEYAKLGLDQSFGQEDSEYALISAGTIFETLKQVLEEGNHLSSVALYKSASSYPLNENQLLPFLKGKKHLIVVEEKRGFLEGQIKEFIQTHDLDIKVYGKNFQLNNSPSEGMPAYGGLNYEIIKTKLNELFKELHQSTCENSDHGKALGVELPRRLPTFCPGCPHRETLSLLKNLREDLKSKNIDLVTHGDVGCYSLSFLPPFKEMHNLSAMGQGGALGAGVDMFTKNPSVVLMGDSTFFHSGLTDISNSVQCGHSITYILLDNDNTAMTGHQMTPASGVSVDGHSRPRQSMLQVVRGLGVTRAMEVNPSDRYFYKNLLEEVVLEKGVKVIVSNKECALTFHGRQKSKERKILASHQTIGIKSFYHINTDACEDCRACVENTGCPGLSQTEDAYGTKVMIDPQICVADSYCTKIKACPSFELVEVLNYHPQKYQTQRQDQFDISLSEPKLKKSFDEIANGKDWRCVVTGVGGSGVTTVSRVLAEAALEMGGRDDLEFKFVDQKGLAQRNGNVTGHMAIYSKGKSYGVPTPIGTADLYVSPDLLDGSQHLQYLSNDGLVVLDEEFQMPLSIMLDQGETKKPMDKNELKKILEDKFNDQLMIGSFKDISSKYFGKTVYASSMILGVSFQMGHLPFSEKNMVNAFTKTMKKAELENNLLAFKVGRALVEHGEELVKEKLNLTSQKTDDLVHVYIDSLRDSFMPWQSSKFLIDLFQSQLSRLSNMFPNIHVNHLAQYLHDIYVYDRGHHSDQFLSDAIQIKEFYTDNENQKMALRTVAKTYFIKDEVFVAHQMISPLEKRRKDNLYKKIGTSYEVTHINRPHFEILGQKIEFDINPKDWMLRLMRHLRVLRFLMPSWHKKENEIGKYIRDQIVNRISKMSHLSVEEQYTAIKKLENIKGYRDVRYKKAKDKIDFNDTENNQKALREQLQS